MKEKSQTLTNVRLTSGTGTVYLGRKPFSSGITIMTIDKKKYSSLLTSALPALIETEDDNDRMLAIIEKLMDKGDAMSPEEEKLFKLLVHLIQEFEHRFYKPKSATPLEVLNELMAANNLKQSDLINVF